MSAEAQQYISELMLQLRELVVQVEDERIEIEQKLRDLPSTSTSNSSASYSTLSSTSPIASPATSGSTKPPSYKTAIKTNETPTHTDTPQRPPRTRSARTLPRDGPTTSSTSTSENTTENLNKLNEHIREIVNRNHILNRARMGPNGAARGGLIVLEGLDRVGKSTLAKKLMDHLEKTRRSVTHCRFPDRSTPVGQLIDDFLKNGSKKVDDHTMHLLFSANRWEFNKSIRRNLSQGTSVILDRYSYSGIAYSSAKSELSLEWCRETERGLPKPDLVIYLELPKDAQYKRPGFGDERFETEEHQEMVRQQYEKIIASSKEKWLRIDVENKSPDQVLGEVIIPVKRCLESCANTDLGNLEFN